MPAYDYRCNDCRRRFTLSYKTYAEYDTATPICPNCGSASLTRLIGRITVAKSDDRRLDDLDMGGNDAALDDMADADPATLGRYMRRMGDTMGEDMGDEFNEVVGRLEKGESVEAIEQTMPTTDDSGGDMAGADSFGADEF